MRVFKSPNEQSPSYTYYLQNGKINKSESKYLKFIKVAIVWDQTRPLACFEFVIQENTTTLLIIPEIGTSIEELRGAFEACSKV